MDPSACTVTVLARGGSARLAEPATFAGTDVLTSALLEGFTASLTEAFERDA